MKSWWLIRQEQQWTSLLEGFSNMSLEELRGFFAEASTEYNKNGITGYTLFNLTWMAVLLQVLAEKEGAKLLADAKAKAGIK